MVSAQFVGCIIWALFVGTSVTAQLCATVVLNGHSPDPQLHAYYTSNIAVLLGGILLVPRSLLTPAPCRRPWRWWSTIGGVFTLPAFMTIPASRMLGVQVVLMTQLLAMLGTALLFDLRRGRVRLSDFKRLAGFGVVLLGVVVENLGGRGEGGQGFSVQAFLLLLGVFASGVGYALQAKCNSRLTRDLGSTARSTAFSACVSLIAGIPLGITIAAGFGVGLAISLHDWPLWLFVGCQSALYIASLARLPVWLGYTTSYLVLLVGKLASSSVADAMGLSGKVVPFGFVRALALAMVFTGTALFSSQGHHAPQNEPPANVSIISSFDPAFVDPATEESELSLEAKLREGIAASAAGVGAEASDHASAGA